MTVTFAAFPPTVTVTFAAFPPTMAVTAFAHLDSYLRQGDWVYGDRHVACLPT